ncbi:MAG TPA: M56 family metallopeptidase, partial [Gemmatimonadaceae bacterium]
MSLQEISAVAGTVLVAAGKGAVVVGVAALVVSRMKGATAAARHAVWAAAIGAHLVLLLGALGPGIPVAVPTVRIERAPAEPVVSPTNEGAGAIEAGRPAPAPVMEPSAGTQGPSRSLGMTRALGVTRALGMSEILALLWVIGAVMVLLRYVVGTARISHISRHAERVDEGEWLSLVTRTAKAMGIARPLTLLRGGTLDVPVTWGIVYPVVLLPRESADWDEERRRFVLVHEMAHVKRLDAVMQVVSQVAMALFWFSPAVWYAAHKVRVEREHACDDQVLLQGTRASFYADELLGMVQRLGRRSEAAPAFAALAMARRSEFEGRMLAILDPKATRRPMTTKASVVTTVVALALVGPLGALRNATASESPGRDVRSLAALGMTSTATPSVPAPGSSTSLPIGSDSTARVVLGAVNTALASAKQEPISVPSAGSPRYRCTQSDLEFSGR